MVRFQKQPLFYPDHKTADAFKSLSCGLGNKRLSLAALRWSAQHCGNCRSFLQHSEMSVALWRLCQGSSLVWWWPFCPCPQVSGTKWRPQSGCRCTAQVHVACPPFSNMHSFELQKISAMGDGHVGSKPKLCGSWQGGMEGESGGGHCNVLVDIVRMNDCRSAAAVITLKQGCI